MSASREEKQQSTNQGDARHPLYSRTSPFPSSQPVPWVGGYTTPSVCLAVPPWVVNTAVHPDTLQQGAAVPRRTAIACKTTPCRHFVKNRGWCPLGDNCGFIHDFGFPAESPQARRGHHNKDGTNEKKGSHCWSFVQGQGRCRATKCQYFHPEDIEPFKRYTPCVNWSNYLCKKTCPYKHADSFSTFPVSSEGTFAGHSQLQYPRVHPAGMTYYTHPAPWMYEPSEQRSVGEGYFFPDFNSSVEYSNLKALFQEASESWDPAQQARKGDTLQTQAQAAPSKQRRHGHAKRISISLKTGEVVKLIEPSS